MGITKYIYLSESFIQKKWYRDTNAKVVFLHLLLNADTQNILGQIIAHCKTTIAKIVDGTGLSTKSVRNAISRLEAYEEIVVWTSPMYSTIEIINFESYMPKNTKGQTKGQTKNASQNAGNDSVSEPIKSVRGKPKGKPTPKIDENATEGQTKGQTKNDIQVVEFEEIIKPTTDTKGKPKGKPQKPTKEKNENENASPIPPTKEKDKKENVSNNTGAQESPEDIEFRAKMTERWPQVMKMSHPLTKQEAEKLVVKYGREALAEILDAMENKKTLLKEYISAYLTANNWCARRYGNQANKIHQNNGNNSRPINQAFAELAIDIGTIIEERGDEEVRDDLL